MGPVAVVSLGLALSCVAELQTCVVLSGRHVAAGWNLTTGGWNKLNQDHRSLTEDSLASAILIMRQFDTTREYYALTLGANRRGQIYWSAYSHWTGWSTRHPKWEMREASIVPPGWMADAWQTVGESWVAVHNDRQFAVFVRIGGNMLVEKEFAELRLPREVAPK